MKRNLLSVSFCSLFRVNGNPGSVIEWCGQILICQFINGNCFFFSIFYGIYL